MATFDKAKKRWAQERSEQADRAQLFKRLLLEKGTQIFQKYKIREVYLFGSVALGRCHQGSDIDIYVSDLSETLYWEFRHQLEEAIQLPVDLYTNCDDSAFVQKIIERGEKVYGT
jgi:predicted nucleotidyltransferase